MKPKYSYPFGIGSYLMNGCYQYIGVSDNLIKSNNNNNNAQKEAEVPMDYEAPSRRKRAIFQNQTNDMRNYCSRYANLEPTIECKVIFKSNFNIKKTN